MRVERADPSIDKGWCAGPWNSDLTVSVGYANAGVDEPHVHSRITEIYMVARGVAEMRVEQETITLEAGDMIVVEPGEHKVVWDGATDSGDRAASGVYSVKMEAPGRGGGFRGTRKLVLLK